MNRVLFAGLAILVAWMLIDLLLLPALHPRWADVFRQKTMQLTAALEHKDEEQRESARRRCKASSTGS